MESPTLHNVRLDESTVPEEEHGPPTLRSSCVRNMAHEVALVAVCTFSAASFVFLQRATVVLTDRLKESLSMSLSEVSWVTAGSGLMTGCFLLPMSYLVENTRCVSRRSILFGTLAVFCVLVGVGACATDGLFLDMVSALAGLACACHIPTAISILSSAYPVPCRRKNMAFAFFLAGANPGGVILGGLGGGLVESRFTWRGSYVYVAAVFGLVAVVAWLAVPTFPRTGEPAAAAAAAVTADTGNLSWSTDAEKHEPPRQQRFNWVAVLFLACGVGTVTASLTLAPETPDGWATPYIFLLLVVGILCLACFVLWEGINPAPLVPSVLWRNRTLMLVILFNVCSALGAYSTLFWVPYYFESIQGRTPFETALRIFPQAVIGLLLGPCVGFIMHNVNNTLILGICSVFQIGSSLLLIFLKRSSSYWTENLPALALSTMSMEGSLNVAAQFIFTSLPREQHAIGVAVMQTMTRLAVPLALGITTAVHTTYDLKSPDHPAANPFTYTFYALLAFGIIGLLLVPFIRIGKQGVLHARPDSPPPSATRSSSDLVDVDFDDEREPGASARQSPSLQSLYETLPRVHPRKSSLYWEK